MATGTSGLDLVARVRRRRPGLPVIVIMAFGGSRVRIEAMRFGATVYLDKPFRVGDFLQTVRDALDSSALVTGVIPIPAGLFLRQAPRRRHGP